jgi:hypothetical protein
VAKCYFAKHKLVWEVLDGGLKNKIEIQWSDIVAIKANFPDDGPETLDVVVFFFSFDQSYAFIIHAPSYGSNTHVILIMMVVMEGCMCLAQLARQPLFFRETNPQPRKHTLWQATSDFTGGQASTHRY